MHEVCRSTGLTHPPPHTHRGGGGWGCRLELFRKVCSEHCVLHMKMRQGMGGFTMPFKACFEVACGSQNQIKYGFSLFLFLFFWSGWLQKQKTVLVFFVFFCFSRSYLSWSPAPMAPQNQKKQKKQKSMCLFVFFSSPDHP